jgi:ferrous iron transport protein B
MRIPFFNILRDSLRGARRTGTCHTGTLTGEGDDAPTRRVLIVGNPNVGKSVLFNRLTGHYVVVSNYPGTTVEVSRGKMRLLDTLYEVVDTPGMYSLRPLSDEERVGRSLLLNEPADIVLHIVDAKNLDRMLPFTLQLIEAGFPVILAVNMMDEAERLGLRLDLERLREELGVPVVGTVALTGRGIDTLRITIDEYARSRTGHAVPI